MISVNKKYMLVQGLFWALFCVAMGFVSLYLLDEGVSNSAIGLTGSIFGLTSAILQPLFGRVCDRSERVSWKKMVLICSTAFVCVSFLMMLVSGKLISAILIGLLTTLANLILPFINTALFYYKSTGDYVNFGVARGIGSGMYALLALIIGNLAETFGTKVVPLSGIIIAGLLILVIAFMPYELEKDTAKFSSNTDGDNHDKKKKEGNFIKKYPVFLVMLLAFIFLQTTHSIMCSFMLQIIQNIGGDSSHLGTAMAIQAVVEVPVLFCFTLILKKFSASKLMVIAAFGYLFKNICYFGANSIPAMYLVQLTQIFSFAIFASASVYYTGEMIDEEDRTTGQSMMASVIVMGNVIGSLLGGVVIDRYGVEKLLLVDIILASIGVVIALFAAAKGKTAIESR